MGKFYYCDQCGKMTWILYSVILKDGKMIDLCRTCYYEMPIDRLELGDENLSLVSQA